MECESPLIIDIETIDTMDPLITDSPIGAPVEQVDYFQWHWAALKCHCGSTGCRDCTNMDHCTCELCSSYSDAYNRVASHAAECTCSECKCDMHCYVRKNRHDCDSDRNRLHHGCTKIGMYPGCMCESVSGICVLCKDPCACIVCRHNLHCSFCSESEY